jgi:hypothetical protein
MTERGLIFPTERYLNRSRDMEIIGKNLRPEVEYGFYCMVFKQLNNFQRHDA